MNSRNSLIPKKIWILWYQGFSEAPFIVKKCIDSWVIENPSWEVIVLDKDNLDEYIALDLPKEKLANLTLTLQSDLIRLQLLSQYGGVWADSTTLCMKSLDDWIDNCTSSGFFAFKAHGGGKIISSWFIASKEKCPLILKMDNRLTSYFIQNNFNKNVNFLQRAIRWFLNKTLNRNEKTTSYWFSPLVTKIFRVYPYFIFHYTFNSVISSNSESQTIWNNTKKMSAYEPHKIQIAGIFSHLNPQIKGEIDAKQSPMYKLTWKYDHNQYSPGTVLHYLLEGRNKISE